jgi:hypothetical protein
MRTTGNEAVAQTLSPQRARKAHPPRRLARAPRRTRTRSFDRPTRRNGSRAGHTLANARTTGMKPLRKRSLRSNSGTRTRHDASLVVHVGRALAHSIAPPSRVRSRPVAHALASTHAVAKPSLKTFSPQRARKGQRKEHSIAPCPFEIGVGLAWHRATRRSVALRGPCACEHARKSQRIRRVKHSLRRARRKSTRYEDSIPPPGGVVALRGPCAWSRRETVASSARATTYAGLARPHRPAGSTENIAAFELRCWGAIAPSSKRTEAFSARRRRRAPSRRRFAWLRHFLRRRGLVGRAGSGCRVCSGAGLCG